MSLHSLVEREERDLLGIDVEHLSQQLKNLEDNASNWLRYKQELEDLREAIKNAHEALDTQDVSRLTTFYPDAETGLKRFPYALWQRINLLGKKINPEAKQFSLKLKT